MPEICNLIDFRKYYKCTCMIIFLNFSVRIKSVWGHLLTKEYLKTMNLEKFFSSQTPVEHSLFTFILVVHTVIPQKFYNFLSLFGIFVCLCIYLYFLFLPRPWNILIANYYSLTNPFFRNMKTKYNNSFAEIISNLSMIF